MTKSPEAVTPKVYLKQHKLDVEEVVRVWTAGESDFGYETFLWLGVDGKPWTSVVYGEKLVTRQTWDVFNPAYYV